MTLFFLGILTAIIITSVDDYCRQILGKLYQNNPNITSKLHIPLFSIFLYYKLRKKGML